MPYCIYLRKSRADLEQESHGDGDTLARHRATLMSLSARMSLDVTEIYEEIVSGETISSRPVMQHLLEEVEEGKWTGVIVMEVERLARGDTIDQGVVARAFEYTHTRIITPTKTYDPANEYDREYFEFGLFMSRREYKTINRRMQAGRRVSVSQGQFLGNIAPYGYEKCAVDKKYTLRPKPGEAEIVQLIFQWYTVGAQDHDGVQERIGCGNICNRLNKMGIFTATGSTWSISTLTSILRNKIYCGKVGWGARAAVKSVKNGDVLVSRPRNNPNAEWYKGLHSALITQETFDLAQYYLEKNKSRPGPKQVACANPLSGLVVCGKCGHKMVRRPYTDNRPASLICQAQTCDQVGSNIIDVEEQVLDALKAMLFQFEIGAKQADNDNQEKSLKEALSTAKKILEDRKKQLARAYDLVETGVYTTEVFLERSRSLSDAIKESEHTIVSLEKEIQHAQDARMAKVTLAPKIRHVVATYPLTESAEEKNKLLRSVIEKIVYMKHGRNTKKEPHKYAPELTIYPAIPIENNL